jgi:predicted RNase H-like HicB family nuclease
MSARDGVVHVGVGDDVADGERPPATLNRWGGISSRRRRRGGTPALTAAARCRQSANPLASLRAAGTVQRVTDALHFTVRYEDGKDGWILAFIDQVPGAMSQGRTRDEARKNVIDALRLMLSPDDALDADPARDSVDLPLAL